MIWAVLAIIFTVHALVATLLLARRIAKRKPPSSWPSILILRPCEGSEEGLRENLRSSLAPYPGVRRVLVLVPSETDPAYRVAHELGLDVRVTHPEGARNRKSAQLDAGLRDAREEVVVQVDSDVRLDDSSLTDLLAALCERTDVAAAFAVPVELEVETFGDFATSALLTASTQSFVVLAALSKLGGGVPALAGAFAAHRRQLLVDTGGFASLEGMLGEDFEVGRRLHARGFDIAVSASPVRMMDRGRSFATVVARTARWMMVVRHQRGLVFLTYPFLLAATPLILIAACCVSPLWPLALTLLAARGILAVVLRRFHRAPRSSLGLSLVLSAEILMLLSFARALGSSVIVWRGRRMRIGRGGAIELVA